jgi:hypothetical protein
LINLLKKVEDQFEDFRLNCKCDDTPSQAQGSEIFVGSNGSFKAVQEDMFIRVGGGYMKLDQYISE